MNFISAKELAAKWGVDRSRILRLAREGRIEGATVFGKSWMFPADAKKPADRRIRGAKEAKQEEGFRFPLYINYMGKDYSPQLSEEEMELCQGQKAFYTCRLREARDILYPLSQKAENRYVRMAALYHCCYLSVYFNDTEDHKRSMLGLELALAGDFPHQQEMKLLRYLYDADTAYYETIVKEFRIDPDHEYHPSAYDIMSILAVIILANGDPSLFAGMRLDAAALLCLQMEQNGHFLEAQRLHFLLVELYQIQWDSESAIRHFHSGLKLAMEHELYLYAAINTYYYPGAADKAFEDLPADFVKMIQDHGNDIRKRFVNFSSAQGKASFLDILSGKDFIYLSLALDKCSNKAIAEKLHISEKSVSRKYREIYDKLGIKNRQELMDMIGSSQKTEQAESTINDSGNR